MQGYYKAQDLSDEVIDAEGWFHTGDIGTLIDNRFLKITDRKKEMFKTSSGKYIAPQSIENLLKESFLLNKPWWLVRTRSLQVLFCFPILNIFIFGRSIMKFSFVTIWS